MKHQVSQKSPQALHEMVQRVLALAVEFTPRERGEAYIRKWIPRRDSEIQEMSEYRQLALMADAILLSQDVLLSAPSMTGVTAFDRLAKKVTMAPAGMMPALAALRQARFRLLRLDAEGKAGEGWTAHDVMGGETLKLADPVRAFPGAGCPVFARVAPLGDGWFSLAGAITPLNEPAFAVARGHAAAGAKNASGSARWAEAVYAHVVRHGTMDVPGLNRPRADFDPDETTEEDDELDALMMDWSELGGAAPPADLLARTRQMADLDTVLEVLNAVAEMREVGQDDEAQALERLLLVQFETLRLRERGGSSHVTLDQAARALQDAIAHDGLAAGAREVFEAVRARLPRVSAPENADLEKLMQRIQALRAKTVAQGCTEQEALAAAEKVAELLDRHGLSLNELEFKAQPCEGIGIQTSRKRAGPIDTCTTAISAFFDCRVWQETNASGQLRYVFFGLRGDVAASQYLYEMVERAFETETQIFRASEMYRDLEGERRTATHSFQTGMARGIRGKLRTIREARQEAMRGSTGRDLVPAKAAIVDGEMEKLGLQLTARASSGPRRFLTGAFEAGEAAGRRFEYMPAVTEAA